MTAPTRPAGDDESGSRSELRLDLDQIRHDSHGLPIDVALTTAFLAQALQATDARVDQTGRLDAHAMLQADDTVLVRGRLHANYVVPCARCLADADVDAGADVCVTYVPRGIHEARQAQQRSEDPEGVELETTDLDELSYDGRTVDLAPLVQELVQVAYPMRALCERGEACRGLCSACGADLNAGADATGEISRCPSCQTALGNAATDDEPEVPAWKVALQKLRDN